MELAMFPVIVALDVPDPIYMFEPKSNSVALDVKQQRNDEFE